MSARISRTPEFAITARATITERRAPSPAMTRKPIALACRATAPPPSIGSINVAVVQTTGGRTSARKAKRSATSARLPPRKAGNAWK